MKHFGESVTQFKFKDVSWSVAIRFLWFALIAGIVVFFFKQNLIAYSQISLSLQTERPELIQVFCDAGKGFNEAQSITGKTSATQQNGEPFKLALPASCNRLRLDLGDKGAVIKLVSASIITSSGDQIDILDSVLSPTLLNEVKTSESDRARFVATASDPWVLLNGEFSKLTATGRSWLGILKMMLMYVIVFGVLAILDYWVNKEENPEPHQSGDSQSPNAKNMEARG